MFYERLHQMWKPLLIGSRFWPILIIKYFHHQKPKTRTRTKNQPLPKIGRKTGMFTQNLFVHI